MSIKCHTCDCPYPDRCQILWDYNEDLKRKRLARERAEKKRYVSINSHTIRKNALTGEKKPPIRIAKTKNDKNPIYANEISIGGGKLIYSPDKKILNCGARLVLECDNVTVLS